MSKYISLLLAAFLFLSITGCKKKKVEFTCTDGSARYPHLAVGHEFVYAMYGTAPDDTMTINIDTVISAGTYKATIRTDSTPGFTTVYYHACDKNLYTSSDGNPNQLSHWWFSLDARPGDTWTRTLGNNVYKYKLYEDYTSVTTPLLDSTYTGCYKFTYNREGSAITDTIYFRPDLGIVFYHGTNSSYELVRVNF
jgi:hypothetical protein